MSSQMSISAKSAEDLFAKFNEIRRDSATGVSGLPVQPESAPATGKMTFFDQLQARVSEVNENAKTADKMATGIVTGKSENLHETMLAASTADLTFNLMVLVRNRALEAYQEVMRMPV